ncbi:MAG: hypothetical protein Q4G67_05395 [Actinomycetia bacterium]|nr:hypothetical protein [Actinomycetes bacterium]
MLAALIALLGVGALVWGTTRYVRSRLQPALQERRERHRALALSAAGVGGVAMLVPDVLAGLLITSAPGGTAVTVGWVLYRLVAAGMISLAVLVMWLSSDPVTARVRSGRDKVVATMPFSAAAATRRLRRREGLTDFPQEWNALLEHDRFLTRELLRYQRDADAAASRPVLADLEHPATNRAVQAMFRCDELRTATAPERASDVLATDYGRAVAEFHKAFAAAQAHAEEAAAAAVPKDERTALADAHRTLTFLQTNATTADERARAYAALSERLAKAHSDAGSAAQSAPAGQSAAAAAAHPWLSVEERARLERD